MRVCFTLHHLNIWRILSVFFYLVWLCVAWIQFMKYIFEFEMMQRLSRVPDTKRAPVAVDVLKDPLQHKMTSDCTEVAERSLCPAYLCKVPECSAASDTD